MHSRHPQIVNRTGTELPIYAEKVLAAMFASYSQIIVKSEFQSGFSGSRVFLVRPVKTDGAELPTVVKIDHAARIQREWQAYQTCIQNRLPNIAEVRGQPVYPPGSLWGGLWYPLMGAGTFEIESLNQYLRHADLEDITYTLESRLFKSMGALWVQTQTVQPDLHLQTYYDSFLPMNLMIELVSMPAGTQAKWLHPSNVNSQRLKRGDFVQVSGFQVVKVSHKTQKFSLDLPSETQAAYRLQIYPVPDSAAFEVGDVIQRQFIGIVRQTRQDLLHEQVTNALGTTVDLTAATLTLPDNSKLPNPLIVLPDLLNHSFDAHVSYIHGDLNLENVLVELESRSAYLIDFAQSRKDHILRDLLHLEMSVVTQLVAAALRENGLVADRICSFYEQLHCAVLYPGQASAPAGLEKPFAILLTIRQVAKRYLFTPDDWSEYFYGLAIYLLGSLRYPNLDKIPGAKAVAFWGTAVTLKLLEADPPCQPKQEQTAPAAEQGSRKTATETHFHGPVTGPIHTGSGNINISNDTLYSDTGSKSKELQLRLDTAMPNFVRLRQVFEVAVSIRQQDSPILQEDDLARRKSGEVRILKPESTSFVRLRVHINAPDCEIRGEDNYRFELYLNQDSRIFYFQLSPKILGTISIIVTVYQEQNWVGSTRLSTIAHEQIVGKVQTQITSSSLNKEPQYRDLFSIYEIGLERLLSQMSTSHFRYGEALVYQQRLTENISRSRRFGDTNLRQADRAEIIEQLNDLAMATISISFNKLCQEGTT